MLLRAKVDKDTLLYIHSNYFELLLCTGVLKARTWEGTMICRKLWGFLTISSDSIFRVVSPPLLRMHCRLCLILILATTNFSGRAAIFTVTTTNSAGTGSLQQAILDANTNPGADTIQFNIPEPGFTISPVSALPALTEQVVIDGSTQP